ncbi:Cytochrome b [Pseudidiomarina planktonica]|uniref:Cytochrome b n=1 Tax=Pseudidiomarina planktonica TaxID=1323738 RepID=A0A1Y6EFN1_9GAMM|nr:cytochrome b/b6 domain-containing protein [Pseudidiomarina planktonica]SMQ58963.1 Cytochrome b [Pseudidiomarina planktonica]
MTRQRDIVIWDGFIRVYHWLLVVLFSLNYFVLEPGGTLHQIAGYSIAGLIIARFVWGFYGSHYARFANFKPSRSALRKHLAHLRQRGLPANSGHNPVGALMIYALMGLFVLQAGSGFLMEEVDYFFGSDEVEAVHAYTADAIFVLVLIHVVAVVLVAWIGRIQLLRPMLTGKRRLPKE